MAFNRLHMDRASGIYSYIADSVEDLPKLPRWSALGSSCYIINESALYIKNGANTWVKQNIGSSAVPSTMPNFQNQIVSQLPLIGQEGILYLVPNSETEENNFYREFLFINGRWEQLGTIESDLIPIDVNSLLEE